MKLHIDTELCTGLGVCESIRPDLFEVRDDDLAYLRTDQFTEADRQDLDDAVDQCPTQALTLEE